MKIVVPGKFDPSGARGERPKSVQCRPATPWDAGADYLGNWPTDLLPTEIHEKAVDKILEELRLLTVMSSEVEISRVAPFKAVSTRFLDPRSE